MNAYFYKNKIFGMFYEPPKPVNDDSDKYISDWVSRTAGSLGHAQSEVELYNFQTQLRTDQSYSFNEEKNLQLISIDAEGIISVTEEIEGVKIFPKET